MDLNELTEATVSEQDAVASDEEAPTKESTFFKDMAEPEFQIGDVHVYLRKVPPIQAMELTENLKFHISGIVQKKVKPEDVEELDMIGKGIVYMSHVIPSLLELPPQVVLAVRKTMFAYIDVTLPDKELRGQFLNLKDDATVNRVFDMNKEGMTPATLYKVLVRSLVFNYYPILAEVGVLSTL